MEDSHPSFPQPEHGDVGLWRYMDRPKFWWLVEHRRIYMPSALHLGEPLEGSAPKGTIEWWKHREESAETEEQRAIERQNREFISSFAASARERYYVSCWHLNEDENAAMWKCYTRTNESVAIKTTWKILVNCLPTQVYIGIVRYIDYDCDQLPSLNLFEYIMHKDRYYEFEREARCVAVMPPPPPVSREQVWDAFIKDFFVREDAPNHHVYAPQIAPSQLITDVILHPEATPEFEKEVATLCAANSLPAPRRSRRVREPIF